MKCTKFTPEEASRWERVFTDEYETSPLSKNMGRELWWTLNLAFHAALDEDFPSLRAALGSDPVGIEGIMHDDDLRGFMMRLYEHGVACGDGGCCCDLGNIYHDAAGGGASADYAAAIELYEMGKELGNAQAAINLGYIYYYGRGVKRDYARAYECFAFGALTEGNPEGFWKLGDLYASGKGVAKSDFTAWTMYREAYLRASDTPLSARAAHHVADYLLSGIEGRLDPNPDAALKLYTEAELGYYTLIDEGLTYYERQLQQAIEGQAAARRATQEHHRRIRVGAQR